MSTSTDTSKVTVTKVAAPPAGFRQRLRAADRRRLAAAALLMAAFAGALTWWLVQRDDLPDGAAFRLGEEVVSADDVDRRIDALEALYGIQVPTKETEKSDFLRDAAKSIAVQIMLEEEAADRDIVIAEKQIDETLQDIIQQRYPDGGRPAFIAALGEYGATEDQVRDEIKDQLLVSRLFDEVAGEVTVDEDELKETFADRRDELATPVRRSLRNIVVADEKTALDVRRRLRAGESFATVARALSLDSSTRDAGGDLGAVVEGDLEKAYGRAAFAAPVGGIFGPVRTESGWNVGRVDAQLPAVPAKYAELRGALRQTVLAEKSLQEWRSWLAAVIAEHDVEYSADYRPDEPGAVPDIDQADITAPPEGEQ